VTRFVLDASVVLTWCFPDEAARKAEEISERSTAPDADLFPDFRFWERV
jgi:hypothetical protein